MQITADANDITKYVDWRSLEIENNLTSQVDLCSFTYKKYGTRDYTPTLADEVIITDDDGTKIFAGRITSITKEVEGRNVLVYSINCMDYTVDLDGKLVAETYENVSAEEIIKDIIDNYTSGFTYNNVSCDVLVDFIAFNYEQVSKCIQGLAELVGYEWYIDYDKDVHFFARGDEVAPFNLEDETGNYIYRSLKLKENYESIKNAIVVRGASYTSDSIVTRRTVITEGEETCDTIEKFGEIPMVEVNGVTQSVGVDHLDDPEDYDCLWNYNEKLIRWRSDNCPTMLDNIVVKGKPEIPIVLKIEDSDSIATYGRREFCIIDNTITTKQAANDRAQAELRAYKDTVSEGSFTTLKGGLRAGQQINISSEVRGENRDFIIKSVITKLRSPNSFIYDVTVVTERTLGIIEFLQNQLRQQAKTMERRENEMVARISDFIETITLEEHVKIKLGPHGGIKWVWGPYIPTNYITGTMDPLDRMRAARFNASCTWE